MRKIQLVLMTFFLLMVSACSTNAESAKLYKVESPVEVEISTPTNVNEENMGTIQVVLTQDGMPVEEPDYVHVEIWKQDGSVTYEMEEAVSEGKGVYSLEKSFAAEGLYFVKVHASSKGSIIMPTKQFVIGTLTESDVTYLNSGSGTKENHSSGHH